MAIVTVLSSGTTFTSSAIPNANFSVSSVILVGTDATFGNSIGFLQFPLPGDITSVDSATLRLFVVFKTGAAPSPIIVNRVTEPFDINTVTYNTMPNFVPTPAATTVETNEVGTFIEIDVTDLVNDWLAGIFVNYGIALTNPDGTTVVQFGGKPIGASFEPQLVLEDSGPIGPTGPTVSSFNAQQRG